MKDEVKATVASVYPQRRTIGGLTSL